MVFILSFLLIATIFFFVIQGQTKNNLFSILMGSIIGIVFGAILYTLILIPFSYVHDEPIIKTKEIINISESKNGFVFYYKSGDNEFKRDFIPYKGLTLEEKDGAIEKLQWKYCQFNLSKTWFPIYLWGKDKEYDYRIIVPRWQLERNTIIKNLGSEQNGQ